MDMHKEQSLMCIIIIIIIIMIIMNIEVDVAKYRIFF